MKFVLAITLILSITLTNAFLFRVPVPDIEDSKAPECVSGYFTAVFAHFNLKQPNQIISCFDNKNAALFFKHIYAVSELSQATENRDHLKVHLAWAKLVLLNKALEPVHGCIAATQDFSDLLNALGAKERDPKLFMLAKYIYYQANYFKLAQELPKITAALDSKDWNSAGAQAGNLINSMADELKEKGLALQSLNALWNGVHIGLDLPDAESVWGCWDNDSAKVRIEFMYSMAAAVAEGSWKDAAVNTEKWYKEKGNDLLKKIPESNWQCWQNSKDTKLESEKLGIDITSNEFYERVNKFVHSSQAVYYKLQKAIKDSLDQYNFHHAGGSYAAILKASAETK